MPRKNKSVYERINITQTKINLLEEQLREQKQKLVNLDKEKDELEMHKMFEHAKENNLSFDDVIKAMSVFSVKKVSQNK